MRIRERKIIEVDAKDFDPDPDKMEDDKIYLVKGGLKVRSNLDEVLMRMKEKGSL